MMGEKARPDRSFIFEVYTYPDNQNMIAIVAARQNMNDNFRFRENSGVPLDYVNEKWILGGSHLF
jgi:hypothetical protein